MKMDLVGIWKGLHERYRRRLEHSVELGEDKRNSRSPISAALGGLDLVMRWKPLV